MPPRPSPEKKFSLRNLRARFKSTAANVEETAHSLQGSPLEKLYPHHSSPDATHTHAYNPYDLTHSEPNSATGLPYSWSSSPSTSASSYFPSLPVDKVLPTVPQMQIPQMQVPQIQVPQMPQIQVTQILATIPQPVPPTPPPGLPPISTITDDCDYKTSDLPWMSHSPARSVDKISTDTLSKQITPAEPEGQTLVLAAESMVGTDIESGPVDIATHVEVYDASVVVHKMKSGINDLPIEIPALLSVLDDIARIHPTISVMILAFKAAYNMEKTRRENDKRILMLYVAMKDMLSVLIQLRDIKDPSHVGHDGQSIQPRLESVSRRAAQDIKDCANACDTYLKKMLVVRVLRSSVWQERLSQFFGRFAERRRDFELALAIHTARAVDAVRASVDDMSTRISELTALVREVYTKEWTPSNEQQLARKIEEKGGVRFVENSDVALSELSHLDNEVNSTNKGGPVGKLQGRTVKGSTFTLQNLKDELFEDWESAVQRNMETFEGKFALYQRQLQEELTKAMQEGTSRIIDELHRGPHDKIKNEELRAIWKEMDWKLNVKARLFVMTLRDHYKERAESAAMSSYSPHASGSQPSDDWAFEFINAKYLQPIMEAFDDDGSGYVTYQEVNEFVEERPAELGWSLPHWVAYWAVGWQITAGRYRDKILTLFNQMFALRHTVKAENRFWADYYLRAVWPVAAELTQSLRAASVGEHIEDKFQAFAEYEEERIRKNLEDIHFDIDALDTVYVVAGPGRIEKYLFPLMYLLLKRDVAIFHVAKTKILHKEELLDAADSLLWVLKAVNYRYLDLSVLFKQNHLNVDNQMKIIACGLFEYLHNSTSLWTWRNLQDMNESNSPELDELDVNSLDADPNKVLNYPLQDEHSFKCSLYDSVEQETYTNVRTSDAVRALLGEWNGFIYTSTQYPTQLMTSFRLVPDPADSRAFRASGLHDGVSFEVRGRCRPSSSQRGRVNAAFVVRYAREYSTQYFSGFVDGDGAFVGSEGWEEDPASHAARFVLKRVTARLMCHRPSPAEFQAGRAKALWRYATRAVLTEVRRWLWSWSYFRERRELRLRYIELSTRFGVYGHTPNQEELEEWTEHRQSVIAVDASFYRILRDEKLKIIPTHDCYCHGCNGKIGGARVVCLDCLSTDSEAKTIDFCDNPSCWNVTANGDKDAIHRHLPNHDVFKVRTVLHLRDVPTMNEIAEKALNVSREYFQGSSSSSGEGPDGGRELDGDEVGNTLELYYDEPSDRATQSQIKCRVCDNALRQPCWFCIDCFAAEEQVYICDDCEAKALLQCTRCARAYTQPTWYYGMQRSDNFMCNTCNWKRMEPPEVAQHKQHTYMHALVRCTQKAECEDEQAELTTDERIGMLERTVGALDGRMGRLEDSLSRIERLLVAALAASAGSNTSATQTHTPTIVCPRCKEMLSQ